MSSRYEDSILRSLQRINQATSQHSHRLARDHQLTAPQLTCLRHIHKHGNITPGQLADAVSLSRPTITGILERLDNRGLLTRQTDPKDKRRTLINTTADAHKLLENAPSALHSDFAQRLHDLHEGEQAMIDWILQRVATLMEPQP